MTPSKYKCMIDIVDLISWLDIFQRANWRTLFGGDDALRISSVIQDNTVYISIYRVLTGHWWKVTYYISGSITHILLKLLGLDYHSWTYITTNFQYIPFHLIFEMPLRKNQTFSHQQNICIVTNYEGFSPATVKK